MLINPNRIQLPTIPGTRILEENFGLPGFRYIDPRQPYRTWVLQLLYAPIRRRRLGGVRAKFMDDKSYISFCNQRDLEVILGLAMPGTRCGWADMDYAQAGDPDWFGLCVDDEDLEDDLLERELRLRDQYYQAQTLILPPNLELERRIHNGSTDMQELFLLLGDADPVTGYGPDSRLETVTKRWVRIERMALPWERADL